MSTANDAVILARVSSKGQQDEGYSLDSQVKLLRNYCQSNEMPIKQVFKIAETATKPVQRRTFKKAMEYIAKMILSTL